jgi:hypothetical protein
MKKIHDTKAALRTFKLLHKQNYTCLGLVSTVAVVQLISSSIHMKFYQSTNSSSGFLKFFTLWKHEMLPNIVRCLVRKNGEVTELYARIYSKIFKTTLENCIVLVY